jgi:molybdopterin molybdotransferase
VPDIVLTYTEAASVVQREADKLRQLRSTAEQIPLLTSLNRILAEPIVADRDQPPFPRSTRDGFACIAADLQKSQPIQIIGQLRAGKTWQGASLESGQAIEIMTGAPVPAGADCVVMIEHVTVDGTSLLLDNSRSISRGENIVPAGAEAKHRSTTVPTGTRITPSHIAVAAACGYANVQVCLRPRVAILATGDELVALGSTPLTHQIRNSNSYSLASQVSLAGALPVILPVASDNEAAIETAIHSAENCDLLLLSGGVSMGKYDFVEQALHALGAEFYFTGAKIQPGRPVVFGRLPQQYFFGLPGNPVSTMVTFTLFAQPLIDAMGGEIEGGPRFVLVRLAHDLRAKPGLTRFLPASVDYRIDGATAAIIPWQGSGDLANTSRANGFAVIPSDSGDLVAGSLVSVLMI